MASKFDRYEESVRRYREAARLLDAAGDLEPENPRVRELRGLIAKRLSTDRPRLDTGSSLGTSLASGRD